MVYVSSVAAKSNRKTIDGGRWGKKIYYRDENTQSMNILPQIFQKNKPKNIFYHDKLNPGLGRNFQVFDPLEFLATLTIHIPAKYKHTVLYFGWYSQAAMGKRKKVKTLKIRP